MVKISISLYLVCWASSEVKMRKQKIGWLEGLKYDTQIATYLPTIRKQKIG